MQMKSAMAMPLERQLPWAERVRDAIGQMKAAVDQMRARLPACCSSPCQPSPEVNECTVCLDVQASVRFCCGHMVCCQQCSTQVRHCPVCRDEVCDLFGGLLPFIPEEDEAPWSRLWLHSTWCLAIELSLLWFFASLLFGAVYTGCSHGGYTECKARWDQMWNDVLLVSAPSLDSHDKITNEQATSLSFVALLLIPFAGYLLASMCSNRIDEEDDEGHYGTAVRIRSVAKAKSNWNRRG